MVERPTVYSFDYLLQTSSPQRVLPTPKSIPPSITSSLPDYLILSLRTMTNLSHLSSSTSATTYPTYFNSLLRYTSTDSSVTSLSLNTRPSSPVPESHYNAHLPTVWLSFGTIVSPIDHNAEMCHGNILDHHMFEGTFFFHSQTFCSLL